MKRSLIASLLSVAHRKPLEFVIKSGADPLSFQVLVQSVEFSAVVGVTECHADDGRRIADRYSKRQLPVWLAAGVSLPDVLAREGVHSETPRVPYTPGWDLVGVVDQIGEGVSGFELGQTVAAIPISGCYAQYVCLPQRKFIPVSEGLDPAEARAVVLNYITAYQMLHLL